MCVYCPENENGVFKMINYSSKNKNNGLVYMNQRIKKYIATASVYK